MATGISKGNEGSLKGNRTDTEERSILGKYEYPRAKTGFVQGDKEATTSLRTLKSLAYVSCPVCK